MLDKRIGSSMFFRCHLVAASSRQDQEACQDDSKYDHDATYVRFLAGPHSKRGRVGKRTARCTQRISDATALANAIQCLATLRDDRCEIM